MVPEARAASWTDVVSSPLLLVVRLIMTLASSDMVERDSKFPGLLPRTPLKARAMVDRAAIAIG